MFITSLSNFFQTAAVFVYNNALIIMAVLFALVILNAVRVRMVAARKRVAAKRHAALQKPVTSKSTFDPFAKIDF